MSQHDGDGDGGGVLLFFAAMISLITIRSPEWSKAQREYISHDVLHIARVAE